MEQTGILPTPPLAPVWPSASLARRAFLAETGSWRLAAVVRDLRRLGWPVQVTDKTATAADGHRQDIAIYSLSPETLAELRQVVGTCPHCAHKGAGSDFFALSHTTSQPSQTNAPEAPQ